MYKMHGAWQHLNNKCLKQKAAWLLGNYCRYYYCVRTWSWGGRKPLFINFVYFVLFFFIININYSDEILDLENLSV